MYPAIRIPRLRDYCDCSVVLSRQCRCPVKGRLSGPEKLIRAPHGSGNFRAVNKFEFKRIESSDVDL